MRGDKWIRLNAGDLTLRTWIGDAQVTYRATWDTDGWNVIRHVSGAAHGLTLVTAERSFAVVEAVVDDDLRGL